MTTLVSIARALGIHEEWRDDGGVHWLGIGTVSVRKLAEIMNAFHARFVTITAYELPKEEGIRLEYHWDVDGKLLGFAFQPQGNAIDSICDLCEAADWIEREVHEGFAVEFTGRAHEPLLLRPGERPGVNLREVVT